MATSFSRSLTNFWTHLTGMKETNSNSTYCKTESRCAGSHMHLYLRIAELKEEIKLLKAALNKEYDL